MRGMFSHQRLECDYVKEFTVIAQFLQRFNFSLLAENASTFAESPKTPRSGLGFLKAGVKATGLGQVHPRAPSRISNSGS